MVILKKDTTLLGIIAFFIITSCCPQQNSEKNLFHQPKLAIGIVVDQMRYDYLTRFWKKYQEGGIKRLVTEGYLCKNTYFNYIPTATGPGHASVFSGTTPRYHGIIGNDFYLPAEGRSVYCVDDTSYSKVSMPQFQHSGDGSSPFRMLSSTLPDQLKRATSFKSKVIGISLKDRASVLPAGKMADAAYWFEGGNEGCFISSTYYIKSLPQWVKDFNAKKMPDKYLSQKWEPLLPLGEYTESLTEEESNQFENKFKGEHDNIFSHDLPALRAKNGNHSLVKVTPFGNSLLVDMALAAIDGEQLGKDDITDFLTLSFSSTDYIGHHFGAQSPEVEDTYLRLDKEFARLLDALDAKVGKGNYLLFLTADHACSYPMSLEKAYSVPAESPINIASYLRAYCRERYQMDFIEHITNTEVYLKHSLIRIKGLSLEKVTNDIKDYLLSFDEVYSVLDVHSPDPFKISNGLERLVYLGHNQKRGGDIKIIYNPRYRGSEKGCSHGTLFTYDTHVPLIFFGAGVKPGSTAKRYEITDIAFTMATLLHISPPEAAIGQMIDFSK